MLPETEHEPSFGSKLAVRLRIALHITFKFRRPEFAIALWFDPMQWAAVPKAAIHKNSHSIPYKDKIRLEAIDSAMQAIPEPQCPDRTT